MSVSRGSCLCGQVVFEFESEFEHFFLCHCQRCRKASGSAHGANLSARGGVLRWLSGESLVKRFDLPGTRKVCSFCSHCGAALPSCSGDRVVIPAGSLDTPVSIRPEAHLFMDSRADWEEALDTLPVFRELP
ncbi:GFA family protein [Marinobacterium lutimaris]|uniref:Uncharacterized conserved protein n=1 Tax=Marinobacterium lutimaris TaxID=568106 RepID=A0A1H5Z492_9GAMM|nr:GFA family protein [Marinobacterium lutimaris]SEG30455.1 Uncharacterized conserved protein [Marinobacterium lutimaris]